MTLIKRRSGDRKVIPGNSDPRSSASVVSLCLSSVFLCVLCGKGFALRGGKTTSSRHNASDLVSHRRSIWRETYEEAFHNRSSSRVLRLLCRGPDSRDRSAQFNN